MLNVAVRKTGTRPTVTANASSAGHLHVRSKAQKVRLCACVSTALRTFTFQPPNKTIACCNDGGGFHLLSEVLCGEAGPPTGRNAETASELIAHGHIPVCMAQRPTERRDAVGPQAPIGKGNKRHRQKKHDHRVTVGSREDGRRSGAVGEVKTQTAYAGGPIPVRRRASSRSRELQPRPARPSPPASMLQHSSS